MPQKTTSFNLSVGRRIGSRYEVEALLGAGSEGEVYRVRDRGTGIYRAAKIYFPETDPKQRRSERHAQKLECLRDCSIVLQYHHSETVTIRKHTTVAVISELCEGQPLQQWVDAHRGKRVSPFVTLTVLHNLASGLEQVHAMGEYHADVHTENILIRPRGVRFDLKLIDFYDWGRPTKAKKQQDVLDAVRVAYDMLGGRAQYAKQPNEVKVILAGLRTDYILKRFPTMADLRRHLEGFQWESTFS